MLEPYTSGSIGAVKNDNSGLAGLEINLGASKGRRSRHHPLFSIPTGSERKETPGNISNQLSEAFYYMSRTSWCDGAVAIKFIYSHSITLWMPLLQYGSWGEPCACILWYREERRRKTRDIYRRHQPLQQNRISDL